MPEAVTELPPVRFRCPTCGVRHEVVAQHLVSFPDDADAIVDLLEAQLNVWTCEACGRTLAPQPPLAVVDTETGRVAIAGAAPGLIEALQTALRDQPRTELHDVVGYAALVDVVAGWANAYMLRATGPLVTGAPPERDPSGIPLAETPLALLGLHEQVDGRLPPRLLTKPPLSVEQQREVLGRIYVGHVLDVLGGLYREAFALGSLSVFPRLVEERIPARCLSGAVLAETLKPCKGWETALLTDSDELSTRLRAEFTNAAAHAIAGSRNPRGQAWARFAKMLFALERNPNVELPSSARLSTDALRRTVRFEDAWDAAVPELSDAKTVDVAEAWFERLGMEERFREHMATMPVAVDLSSLAQVSDDQLATTLAAALDQDDDARLVLVTGMARAAIRAGRSGAARLLLERELDRLADRKAWELLARQMIRGLEALRDAGEQDAATELLGRHVSELTDAPLDPTQRAGLLNEIGNAARYAADHSTALHAYKTALAWAARDPEATVRDDFVIRRNVAIVQRERGAYSDAVRILEELEIETRGELSARRASVLTSLAMTFLESELPKRALPLAQDAHEIPLSLAEAPLRATVLLARAAAQARTGSERTLDDYAEALALTESMPALHARVACLVLRDAAWGRVPADVLSQAEAVIRANLAAPELEFDDTRATETAVLAEYYLESDRGDDARALLAPLAREGFGPDKLPWQLNLLAGRLDEEREPDVAFAAMRAALEDLDAAVPEASGLAFATPWIGGRTGAQEHIARVYHRAVARGAAAPLELASLADFLYARDVPGVEGIKDLSSGERLQAVATLLPEDTDLTLLIFLEDGEDVVALVVNPREGEPQLERLATPSSEIRAAAARFARGVGPTCVLPEQKQRAADQIADVLADVGRLVRDTTVFLDHVCIIPSPALVGLPLHAATAEGEPLLERNPIISAPSLRTLHRAMSGANTRGPRPGTVVSVPKDGDSKRFRALLAEAADAVVEGLKPLEVRRLRDEKADKSAVLAALGSSEQVLFLGHGAEGGELYGRGLCVSDGTDLPRGPLPVDLVPQLRRYVIDAADLERERHSPAVFVSMACSSGRARPGPGGTRIGLERSMFANGTHSIVAPLWDVAQEPALEFILTMLSSWRDRPDLTLGEHHRRAARTVREEHPLLFDWAPFALNGSFI